VRCDERRAGEENRSTGLEQKACRQKPGAEAWSRSLEQKPGAEAWSRSLEQKQVGEVEGRSGKMREIRVEEKKIK